MRQMRKRCITHWWSVPLTENWCPDRGRLYKVIWTGDPHNKSSSIKRSVTVCDGIHFDSSIRRRHIFPCPYRALTPSNRTAQQLPHHMVSHYNSGGVGVWLAFAFCFVLLLFVGGAAAGGSWVHWWSPQFLDFGFFHFLLNGLDV